jgi:hypothetical protein
MSACLLLDTFQKYFEVSFVFGLSICTATANTTVGNGNVLVGFFFEGRGGEYCKKDRTASNFREDENMFLSPCMKKCLSARCFLKDGLISSACRVEFI